MYSTVAAAARGLRALTLAARTVSHPLQHVTGMRRLDSMWEALYAAAAARGVRALTLTPALRRLPCGM